MGLTKKQREILNFIERYQKKNKGISPTLEEIKNYLNLRAVSTVFGHIERLKKQGLIEKNWNSKRDFKIIKKEETKKLPLVGIVSAGSPIEVFEDKEYVDLPEFLTSSSNCFLLRVKGNSMIDEGIQDGDYIILKKKEIPENGELVVALVKGEATLKKFYREGEKIKLIPANPSYNPIYAREEEVNIQGVVIGLIRKY